MPNLLDIILQDTFVKNAALKKTAVLKDHLLEKVFTAKADPQAAKWGVTPQNIYEVFDNLEKSIKALEPLVIYLPYELPEEQIIEIGQKLRSDYGKNFLMDIQIDPSLIAGAALSYKGIYKDTSVKQRIIDNQKEILATFRKYIKH